MAVQTLYPNMYAETSQSQNIILTKILAWLIELVSGGVPGSTAVSVLSASAAANHQVVKTSSGIVLSVNAHNSSGSTRYLHVFDATALPFDGTIPTLAPVQVPTDSTGSIDFISTGRPFSTGLVVAFSSTATTLTNAGGGMFDVVYR
jgi:hypothetical protein